ncbi:MAG: polyhydroxyalkanoate synthesis repressor PhaR [Magnetococcales bacterium]|nr:polyhydroxyalkanoate synthesis repressor PhaR [Magnetococcales bacterium]
MADPVRMIKKYPNRRLYDTEESAYITLEEVRQLVLRKVVFQVVDSRSGEELTRAILLQIISEQEHRGDPVFTADLLQRIIRLYGDTVQTQGMFTDYLDKSLQYFMEHHDIMRQHLERTLDSSGHPLNFLGEMARQNFSLWYQWQEALFSAFTTSDPKGPDGPPTQKP